MIRLAPQTVLFTLLAFVASATVIAKTSHAQDYKLRKGNPAFAEVIDDPNLPRALIVGDSISIGYTVPLRKELQGKVNVHRIPTNGGPTTRGLENIDAWLGESKWDVIHFNWGLHDLKYINDKKALVPVDQGTVQVPLEEYQVNLTKLVKRLKKTEAKLIWRSTTPVPKGARGRVPGSEVEYNKVAAEIMKEHNVPTDDLYSFSMKHLKEIQQPKNVHFTPAGSGKLAEQVAAKILVELNKD